VGYQLSNDTLELLIDFLLAVPADPALLTDQFGEPYPLMAARQLQLQLAEGISEETHDRVRAIGRQMEQGDK